MSAGGAGVSLLLLGDPTMDTRVIKTTRTLQEAGFAVTLFCLARRPEGVAAPDLGGATIHWVDAPRPLASLARLIRGLRRVGRPPATAGVVSAILAAGAEAGGGLGGVQAPARPGGARRLLGEVRALLGTLWLNLALYRAALGTAAAAIHANDLDTLLAGVLLKRRLGSRLVYDAHELYPEMFASTSALYVGLWRLLEHRLIGSADGVVTVNRSIAGELRRRHRLPITPTVVMNCPPLQPLPGDPDEGRAGEFRLLYLGRYNAERGLLGMLRAMPLVDRRAVLCLRGGGPLQAALEGEARLLGVADRVRFLPAVAPDRLVGAMGGYAIGIVPYLPTSLNNYLCTPNKLFEYLMGGLAVVASDLPELRAVVAGEGLGLLYAPGDPMDLARAIHALLADPARLEVARAAARRAAEGRYNWAAQAVGLGQLYAGLSGDRPR